MKAQTATEYIIILSVVLIIVAIVLGSLSKLPTIGNSSDEQNSQRFWQTADIAITAAAFTDDNTASNDTKISLTNNFPTVIQIQQVNISTTGSDTTDISLGITVKLNPGEEVAKQANLNTNNPCYGRTTEDSYGVAVVIKYDDLETGNTYYYRGASNRLKGKCAESLG